MSQHQLKTTKKIIIERIKTYDDDDDDTLKIKICNLPFYFVYFSDFILIEFLFRYRFKTRLLFDNSDVKSQNSNIFKSIISPPFVQFYVDARNHYDIQIFLGLSPTTYRFELRVIFKDLSITKMEMSGLGQTFFFIFENFLFCS